jgi:hypothetical protein
MSISKIQYSLSKYLFTCSLRQIDGKNYTSTCFLNDIVMMQSIHCNCTLENQTKFIQSVLSIRIPELHSEKTKIATV